MTVRFAKPPLTADKENIAGGVAGLDGSAKVSLLNLPASTQHLTAASQAAMLALSTAVPGDQCTRTDLTVIYQLAAAPYSTLANWIPLGSSPSVASVGVSAGLLNSGSSSAVVLAPDFGTTTNKVARGDAVGTHASATDPHSDRAYTDTEILAHRGDVGDMVLVPLSQLNPVVTGTAPAIGDVPYRSVAMGSAMTFQWQRPQSWTSYDISLLVAKNFNADGTVLVTASSGSDPSNQLVSGDSPATASAHISTTWTVPAGSTTTILHQIVEVPIATVQVFETAPTLCNQTVEFATGTFGNHPVAVFGVVARRSSP